MAVRFILARVHCEILFLIDDKGYRQLCQYCLLNIIYHFEFRIYSNYDCSQEPVFYSIIHLDRVEMDDNLF